MQGRAIETTRRNLNRAYPKTGEEVPISPRRVMTFKASNVLKTRILKAHVARKIKLKPQNPAP